MRVVVNVTDHTISAAEVGERLKMHPKTVCAKAAAGEIPGAKVGRDWLFVWAAILSYLRSQYGCDLIDYTSQP